MHIATQRLLIFAQAGNVQCGNRALSRVLINQFPDTFQEAVCPFNAGLLPFQSHICRRGEHHEQTNGIRAVAFNHHLRVDAVVLRLGHFAHAGVHQLATLRIVGFDDTAFFIALHGGINRRNPVALAVFTNVIEGVSQYHPLAQQLFRRLVGVNHTRVAHQLMEEAEVQQVHNRMFDPADVNIDRQPVVGGVWIQHSVIVLRAGIARVVPGGFHKGIESVGFAQRRLTVNGGFCPLRIGLDWAGDAVHDHIFRQNDRQLIFRGRHDGTVFEGDHWNRCAPVTLTGNAPVAKAIVNFAFANAHGRQFVGNSVEARFVAQAVELAGVEQGAFFSQRLLGQIRC